MAADGMADEGRARQRHLRRSALLWGLIAAAFYVGFIILTVVRASR